MTGSQCLLQSKYLVHGIYYNCFCFSHQTKIKAMQLETIGLYAPDPLVSITLRTPLASLCILESLPHLDS